MLGRIAGHLRGAARSSCPRCLGRKSGVRRWATETVFSTFKCLYGEYCMAKTWKIAKELAAKAYIYNVLINL
jgi:hypothetical protein